MSTPTEVALRLAFGGVFLKDAEDSEAFEAVHRRCGDPDLAVDAILLVSRPAWLSELIGDRLRAKAAA